MLRAKPPKKALKDEKRESQRDKLKALLKDHVKIKRLNVEIPNPLYKQMQRRAVDEGRSISTITRQIWTQYLKDQNHVQTRTTDPS